MTPMWPIRARVSIHMLAVGPSGRSRAAIPSEKKAPLWYGKFSPSVLTAAPRKIAYVKMTRKIMKRISQAPPVWEP